MSNLPIGLFLLIMAIAMIIAIIKFKKEKKAPIIDETPEVAVPVEDIFNNLGIDSEVPKIVTVKKKPKKTPVKKSAKKPVKKAAKKKPKSTK